MRVEAAGWIVMSLFVGSGCAAGKTRPGDKADVVRSVADARGAVEALQASRFDEAEKMAADLLAEDDRNAQAHLVAALTRYKRAMHQLTTDVVAIGAGAFVHGLNKQYLAFALTQADAELEVVARHLAAAARDPDVSMEQCLARWRVDWNRSGKVDQRDMILFQIELDADGNQIPEGDPRRTPTFRFDSGDVYWARAMVAFQRAVLNLVMAYEIPEPRAMIAANDADDPAGRTVTIRLKEKARVHRARDLILAGLAQADRCRREYLAETDDDREWLPNPRQKSHPLPLPVDEKLYATWEGVLTDLGRLIAGEEGLDVAEVAQLGDHQWADPPRGFIHVGRLLEEPRDIVLDFGNVERLDHDRSRQNVEAVLADVFGDKYKPKMKPTLFLLRLSRMKGEIERGEESLERKLRYLLWLN